MDFSPRAISLRPRFSRFSYNFFTTSSNAYIAWLLGQTWGSLQIPLGLGLRLLAQAPGWYAALPPNP
jgi:hypothetical protein